MPRLALALAPLALAFMLPAGASATPGDFDTSFGSNGLISGGVGQLPSNQDTASDVAVLPDGRIVVAGHYDANPDPAISNIDFFAARFLASGAPDPSFGGGDGFATTPVAPGNATDFVAAVAVDGQGRVVVGGQATMPGGVDFAMVRFTPEGQLDASFDGEGGAGNGVVTASLAAAADAIHDLLLQPDGRIVAAGNANTGANGNDFAVARFNDSGAFDDGFSGNGFHTVAITAGAVADVAEAVTLAPGPTPAEPDLVLAGSTTTAGGGLDFAALRVTATGAPDSSFGGGDGVVTVPAAPAAEDDEAQAVAYTRDGVVMAGSADLEGTTEDDVALVRLTDAGVPDPGFGNAGVVTRAFAPGDDSDDGSALAVQPDGKLVVAGLTSVTSGDDDALIARFLPGGSPDPTFGSAGRVSRDVSEGSAQDWAQGVAIEPDGQIVAAGRANGLPVTGQDFFVVRLHGLEADLSVSIAESAEPAAAGAPLTYTATVTNAGPDPAENVTLTGVPSGTLGTIPAGGSATVTATQTPGAPGSASAAASVQSSTYDSNQANNSAAQTTTVADLTAPALTSLSLSARRFRVGRRATPVSAQRRRRAPAGTRFRFSLSEASSVRIAIQRALPGRRVGSRCRKPSRRLRKRRRCTRYSRARTLTRRLGAGRQSVAFSGRIGRRPLAPGAYRATVTATDAAGNRSAARRIAFRIVR
jgi:uncharacterized delta-60 repeat protein/uncharacterized repeat protein (TIGR01451 family)